MPVGYRSFSSILLALASALFQAAVASGLMAPFSPPGECVSVYMEGNPTSKTVILNGISPKKCYAHEEKNGSYWITWTDFNVNNRAPAESINRSLNWACEGTIAGMSATTTARYSVKLPGGYPGRQVEGILPGNQGYFRMRVFLVGNRLYQLIVTGSQPYLKQEHPNQFLSSLKITNQTATSIKNTNLSGQLRSAAPADNHQTEIQAQSTAFHESVPEQQNAGRKASDSGQNVREYSW